MATPDTFRWVPGAVTVLEDVLAERFRQVRKYGSNEDLEFGTGPEARWLLPYTSASAEMIEKDLRADYEEFEEDAGKTTWVHLIREEVAEAFKEEDPERLREELVQVAALAVSCIEQLDARAKNDKLRGAVDAPEYLR